MKAFSLFSGCGGCSLGLKQAGFDVVLAADINEDACRTYATNINSDSIWTADLSTITTNDLWERSGLEKSQVDLIVGGPPCQGFSSAGARNWDDPRNTLLKNFVEIVTSAKPTWFVMENVEGLLTANQGFFITEAITRLLEAGYWVRAKKIYMERYGVPQRRKRVLVVGNLEGHEFDFPVPTYRDGLQQMTFDEAPTLSILDAIADLPSVSEQATPHYSSPPQNEYQSGLRRADDEPILHHQAKRLNPMNQQRVRLLAQGETMRDLPEDLQHPSFNRRAYRRVMDGTPTDKRGGAPSGLKRLDANSPSLTITSAASSEFIHPLEDRLLTLRECARIQSFPDWFELHGSWSSVATQIGNAIPPLIMQVLAKHIAGVASWRPKRSSAGRWLGIDATKSTGMSPALVKMLTQLEERASAYAG
jgi:DNA (cytosine-5)-methyltransferase 1